MCPPFGHAPWSDNVQSQQRVLRSMDEHLRSLSDQSFYRFPVFSSTLWTLPSVGRQSSLSVQSMSRSAEAKLRSFRPPPLLTHLGLALSPIFLLEEAIVQACIFDWNALSWLPAFSVHNNSLEQPVLKIRWSLYQIPLDNQSDRNSGRKTYHSSGSSSSSTAFVVFCLGSFSAAISKSCGGYLQWKDSWCPKKDEAFRSFTNRVIATYPPIWPTRESMCLCIQV